MLKTPDKMLVAELKKLAVTVGFAAIFLYFLCSATYAGELAPAAVRATGDSFVLRTEDTTLAVRVNADQHLLVSELSSPAGWNWTAEPSVFPLMQRVEVDGVQITPAWTHASSDLVQDNGNGSALTTLFTCADPPLELKLVWQAHRGPGPVHLAMFVTNRSNKPVTIFAQESLDVCVAGPGEDTSVWYIHDDGSVPDAIGVYHDALAEQYSKELSISEGEDFIPLVVVDAGGAHGVYFGWEWSIGRMTIASHRAPAGAHIKAGNGDAFKTDLAAGETFEVPPAFIGAYKGDLDDMANSLHKYLFQHAVPEALRQDATFPRLEWNAFAATGMGQGSWIPTETKYYPLIDDIAPLGFEDVVIDVGWWQGDTVNQPHPPVGHAENWPQGMLAACRYAQHRNMRFGLYWNCNPPMTTLEGMQHRMDDIKYLFDHFQIDYYRSDGTDGNVLQTGGAGPGSRAHYAEDCGYWQTKGFYDVTDWLQANVPNFLYENCSGGGRIKDYGVMKRAMRIQNQDRYYPIDARRAFWDASYALHPMQLSTLSGSWSEWQASGSVYEFRSASLGAPAWHPDAPNGGNGGPPWSDSQKLLIKQAVETYKQDIRPLVRTANLYHVLPRPDDKVWDGIEYFDPISKKGAVIVFRPDNPMSRQVIKLKGLEPQARYWIWCEDGSLEPQQASGAQLMSSGLTVTLPQPFSSDIVFLQDETVGKPDELVAPGEFELISATPEVELFSVSATLAWTPSDNARHYRVTVSESADFAQAVVVEMAATTSFRLSDLPPARPLYWKVEAISRGGTRLNAGGPGTFTTPERATKGVVFASDVEWKTATVGSDSVHRDSNINGQPLTINGKRFQKGLWTHAFNDSTPAEFVFDVSSGKYSTFKATVGVEDAGTQGSVQFQILVDGVKQAETPVLRRGQTCNLAVNLDQVKELTLRVLNGGDGYVCDHATWGYARFLEPGADDPLENGP